MADRGRHLRRAGARAAIAVALIGPAAAQPACERAEFEAAVAEAAKALRDLNQRNKPAFQGRLRELKEKRGWSHDQFLRDAAAFVQDAEIADYDNRSNVALESIQRIGAAGASGADASCKALGEVRSLMKTLVEVQTEKWTYMFKKLTEELAR